MAARLRSYRGAVKKAAVAIVPSAIRIINGTKTRAPTTAELDELTTNVHFLYPRKPGVCSSIDDSLLMTADLHCSKGRIRYLEAVRRPRNCRHHTECILHARRSVSRYCNQAYGGIELNAAVSSQRARDLAGHARVGGYCGTLNARADYCVVPTDSVLARSCVRRLQDQPDLQVRW